MRHLASRENPRIKALRKLAAGGGRAGSQVLLDGIHLCRAWLEQGRLPELAVFDAGRLDRPELARLAAALPGERCLSVETVVLRALEGVESGQGVLFLVEVDPSPLPARIDETCVWLDGVQDPGNVGTLLRTCAAAGVRRVLAGPGTAGAWTAKVLRSAQGAHFALDIHERVHPQDVLARLDVPLVATALDGAADLYDAPLPARCAWVFGHEGQGVSPGLLRAAALRVRIDHERPGAESLNVAVAAAICLFEQRRRLRAG